MTVTQAAFLLFGLGIAPGFGLAGALAGRGTRLRARWGAALGAGAAWLGLGASGVAAIASFPRYPLEGPPEHVALLFLIPGFVCGVLAVLATIALPAVASDGAAERERARREARSLLFAGVGASALLLLGVWWLFAWPFNRALPWSARAVRESGWTDGFLPDFSYCLKARVPEAEVGPFLARVGLTEVHSATRVYTDHPTWLSWAGPVGGDTTWWDPPPVRAGRTYVSQHGDLWVLADYEAGWLYVSAAEH